MKPQAVGSISQQWTNFKRNRRSSFGVMENLGQCKVPRNDLTRDAHQRYCRPNHSGPSTSSLERLPIKFCHPVCHRRWSTFQLSKSWSEDDHVCDGLQSRMTRSAWSKCKMSQTLEHLPTLEKLVRRRPRL